MFFAVFRCLLTVVIERSTSACTAKIQELEMAFRSSEFHRLVVESTDDSLNRALDLFDVPPGVDVTLRGRPAVQSFDEVSGPVTAGRLYYSCSERSLAQ